jgi:CRP/FNR family transcriptional regulator, cyclic AMP receptor protein
MVAGFNWVDGIGYLGASITLGTYSMKRMIPLRIIGMCANCVFITYGLLAPVYPQLLLHAILLPLNAFRLREMLQLTAQVKNASQGDLNMEWLKPYMASRSVKRGDVLFRKCDPSTAMFYTVEGRYRLPEIKKEIGPGQIIGEIGLIAPDKKRTLTFEAIEDGGLLTISDSQVKQLYYQNPEFGFYLLRLIGERLFEDIERDMRLTKVASGSALSAKGCNSAARASCRSGSARPFAPADRSTG